MNPTEQFDVIQAAIDQLNSNNYSANLVAMKFTNAVMQRLKNKHAMNRLTHRVRSVIKAQLEPDYDSNGNIIGYSTCIGW